MKEFLFEPFPELLTERLFLRQIGLSDTDEIFFLRSDDSVMKYIDKDKEKSKQETRKYIRKIHKMIENGEAIVWGIALNENRKKLIGSICLWHFQKEHYRAEAGFVLHPEYWRKGYMKEAILSVVDFGFRQLQLHSIEAMINPDNTASAAVLKSSGFVQEAYFKENYFFNGMFLDTAVFSILYQPEKG